MKRIVEIPDKVVEAIQNGEDYRYDIHTAIAQSIPYEEPLCPYLSDDEVKQPCLESPCEKPQVKSDRFVSYTKTCHICGYSLATYNPEDYKFCPRCGMEFGV